MSSVGDDMTSFGRSVYDDKMSTASLSKPGGKKRKHASSGGGHRKKKGGLAKKYKKR